MRILVITYEYPPIGGGGGMAAQEISRELARRGHEVQVLTAHFQGLPSREETEGVLVIRLRSLRRSAYKANLSAMFGYVLAGSFAGLAHIRRWRPDIIHVHFAVPSGPVGWLLNRLGSIPYVLTAHLGDVPGGVPEKTGRWFRWIYPFTPPIWKAAFQVVAVSEYTRSLALKHYPVEIQVIPNAANLQMLDPTPIMVQSPPRVVFAGRFMQQKNPVQFVQILAELQDLEWDCVMMGDGPLRSQVEQEIERAGLGSRFSLPGWVTPDLVIQHFKSADILLMPSSSEGLPVVGVQALALGLAIVASRIGGFIDLVENDQNGYLIESGDTSGFELALRKLLSNPQKLLEFRLSSRQKAQDFDIQSVATAYEQIFQRLL